MTRTKLLSAALAALLVTAAVTPAAASVVGADEATNSTDAQDANARAYSGTHVAFDVQGDAVTNYSVNDDEVLTRVEVASKSEAESGIGLTGDLSAVTSVEGSALSMDSSTRANATVHAESGARLSAHDNQHGILVVAAGEDKQVVTANVSSDAEAEAESDSRVVVTSDDGESDGAFVVVGNGSVTTNDDGNVTADLGANATLVFRAYPDGRDEQDEREEELVANGTAAAEVYVTEDDGQTVVDTVSYDANTTVTAEQTSDSEVEMTVNRTRHEGKVVMTTVSEAAVGSFEEMQVYVDGEAAVRASSTAAVKNAIGSDTSKFTVTGRNEAEATGTVLVGVNHFSTRTLSMGSGADATDDGGDAGGSDGSDTDGSDGDDADSADGDDADGSDSDGSSSNDGGQPGFGALTALAALGAALLVARRRH